MDARWIIFPVTLVLSAALARADEPPAAQPAAPPARAEAAAPAFSPDHPAKVFVVPIDGPIGQPTLYIVRRAVKDAIVDNADFVVLDMNTPGGELDATLKIMKALDEFKGVTMTYVDTDATSAGSIIASATREIYMAPRGTIGSAEPVNSGGGDIGESMHRKVTSYVLSKVRSYTGDKSYRAQVVSAMIDPDIELVIDGKTISKKGELLNLTAEEATAKYGDPPQPLLAAGIAKSLRDLFVQRVGAGNFRIREFEMSWSMHLARYLMLASPLLLGIGGLFLFIEFKTPGFGFFGVTGIILVGLVFFGHYMAGLAGHEPFLIFLLGVVLVAVELFFFPGTVILGVSGAALMMIALVWGMSDIWPGEAFHLNADMLVRPLLNLIGGMVIAGVLMALVGRFLPKTLFWDRLVLSTTVRGSSNRPLRTAGQAEAGDASREPHAGSFGRALTDLFPSGFMECNGKRYQVRLDVGSARAGSQLRVIRKEAFVYVVEVIDGR